MRTHRLLLVYSILYMHFHLQNRVINWRNATWHWAIGFLSFSLDFRSKQQQVPQQVNNIMYHIAYGSVYLPSHQDLIYQPAFGPIFSLWCVNLKCEKIAWVCLRWWMTTMTKKVISVPHAGKPSCFPEYEGTPQEVHQYQQRQLINDLSVWIFAVG